MVHESEVHTSADVPVQDDMVLRSLLKAWLNFLMKQRMGATSSTEPTSSRPQNEPPPSDSVERMKLRKFWRHPRGSEDRFVVEDGPPYKVL